MVLSASDLNNQKKFLYNALSEDYTTFKAITITIGTIIIGSVISEVTSTPDGLLLYIPSLGWIFLAGGRIKCTN